ncbi:ABC transporter permease [Murimonas intestini]|uniref:Peptide/nickel transport system permease protein/glutathione transport system permease protein/oligopeptide transport system permease protein n=1 Tax=Murimonas intestini TaxID=1337051 RepID=A0AB73T0V3_9FIRM|nr:ABC transporter permease [Murimonas intestini]MCR1840116.1 ABC transporter permease [Murimonas intestini]MCR1867568.1 ABC transporter permease [Murimonas intestini]MCR1885017.1 ABC transporter permease [Murimonas intestini]
MSKITTPAMVKLNKKTKGRHKETGNTPMQEGLKRLRKNKTAMAGMIIILFLIIIAIFAPLIAPYGYQEQSYTEVRLGPSLQHLFGTDHLGRDIFSRCVYGTRYSLPIGLICTLLGLVIGGGLGLVAAYFGGRTDNIIMRIIDIIQAIPSILLCIALVAILGNGMWQLVVAITAGTIQGMTKNVRAAVFMVRNNEYVNSSKSIGVSDFQIMIRHLVPNAVGIIVINAVGVVATSILTISSLSYLGVGLVAPTPEWGAILAEGKQYMAVAPHMVYFPGLMIAITVVAFYLFGNGLRDALDPRLK